MNGQYPMTNIQFRGLVIIMIVVLLGGGVAVADSIWKEDESTSPYSTQKAYRVGDVIGILILENTSAAQKAGTDTDVKDDLTLKLNYALNRATNAPQSYSQLFGEAQNKYKGLGKTQRSANVTARVSARVVEVLPRGNLKIVGTHRIEVNNDEQQIIISGIIRAKDVTMGNTVYSYQVAQPDIVIKGAGVVQEAEAPGWITRIFNWIF